MNIKKNVRLRLTLWYTFVLAAMLLAFNIVVYILLSNNLNRRLDAELKLRADHLSVLVESAVKSAELKNIVLDVSDTDDYFIQQGEFAQIFDLNGTRMLALGLAVDDSTIQPFVIQTLRGEGSFTTMMTMNQQQVRVYAAPILAESISIGVILLGHSTSSVVNDLSAFKNTALIASLIITLTGGGGGILVTSRALKPVRSITETAQEIGAGDLMQRIEVSDSGEIGKLAATLNDMFDRLQSAFTRERRFTSDASHELRTPLAIIEAEATLTLERTRSKDDYKKALGMIAQEATHMSAIIGDLLFLARSEAVKETLNLEPIKLGDFIEDLISDVSVLSRRKKLKLAIGRLDNPVVQGDRTRLTQLFFNIMENAIRYTAPKGIVSFSLIADCNKAVVRIADTGIGVPVEDLKHIFEPFYRADKGRARTEGGTGLGLAIGQRIAKAHGGDIEVESRVDKGSIFSVVLPVNAIDQPGFSSYNANGNINLKTKHHRTLKFPFWR